MLRTCNYKRSKAAGKAGGLIEEAVGAFKGFDEVTWVCQVSAVADRDDN
jgi:hypothetical protein